MYAAIITAGGRLNTELTAACGTDIKALAPLSGKPFIQHIETALRDSGMVSAIAVAGPVGKLQAAGLTADVWAEESATGPENILRGIAALRAAGHATGDDRILLCATDAVFLTGETIRELIQAAEARPDADIVFPIVRRERYDAQFPGSPNTYAPLREGWFTGSSVQIVRPSAIERSLPYIERAFAARKSQWEMAKLLGVGTILRFITRKLTLPDAVARISTITGLNCYAPIFEDACIAADIDVLQDYTYAVEFVRNRALSVTGQGKDTLNIS